MPDLSATPVSRELQVLLCAARLRLDDASARRLVILTAGELDWNRLVSAATSHGLAPLLLRHWAAGSAPGIPKLVVERLRAEVERTTIRNLRLLNELFQILAAFDAQHLAGVPHKGPALGSLLYGDPALRPSCDLDLLVRRCEVRRAADALQARGYEPCRSRAPEELEYECTREFVRSDGTVVELHWRLAPRYFAMRLDAEDVWEDLESATLYGRRTRALPLHWLLPILCVHATKHCWNRLEWLCDVALAIDRSPDWPRVLQTADRIGSRRMLLLGVELARVLIGCDLPAIARRAVDADCSVAGLVRRVIRRLSNPPPQDRDFAGSHRLVLAARERTADRIRYVARLAARPSPGDHRIVRLPPGLRFLYTAVKPFRVGARVCADAVSRTSIA